MKKERIGYGISGFRKRERRGKFLSCYSTVVGDELLMFLQELPLKFLDYALLSAPGAPLKQALLDAQIGMDVYGSYDDGIMHLILILWQREQTRTKKKSL